MFTNVRQIAFGAALIATGLVSSIQAQTDPVDQGPSLFDRLPQNVMFAVGINDISELGERLGTSKFGDAWDSPEMEPMRDFMDNRFDEMQEEISEEADFDLKSLKKYAQGEVAFAGVNFYMGDDYNNPGAVLLDMIGIIEISPDVRDNIQSDLDLLIDQLPENSEKSSYEVEGYEVRTITITEEYTIEEYEWQTGEVIEVNKVDSNNFEYAFTENYFLFGEGVEKPLGKVLTSFYSEGEPGLSDHPGINRLNENYQGTGDVKVWANFPGMMSFYREAKPDSNAEEITQFLDASGFSTLEGAGLQMSLFDQGLLSEFAVLMPAERKGIVEAFYTGENLSLDSARYVPEDAYKYSAFMLDVGKIWDATMIILEENSPEMKQQLDFGIAFANGQIQTDLVETFLRRIKGEHMFYQTRDPEAAKRAQEQSEQYGFDVPEQLQYTFHIAVDQAPEFHTALEQVMDTQIEQGMLPVEKSDFQGVNLYQPS